MGDYKARIETVPEHIVYYKDYYAPTLSGFLCMSKEENFLQDLCDRVLYENPGIRLAEPEYSVLMYMDGDFGEEDIRFRFCDAVSGYGRDFEDYQFAKVDGFMAVTVEHKGPYKKLGETYAYAKKWLRENGYKQAGIPRDRAVDGCWNMESEEEYLTEIQIPIEG